MTNSKKTRRPYSLVNVLIVTTVSLAVFSFVVLYLIWMFDRMRTFESKVSELRDDYIQEQEVQLRYQLSAAVDFLQFNKTYVTTRVKQSLQERVNDAWSIADHLYQINKDSMADEQIRVLIKEALRTIRFNHGRGYYFATGFDGIEQLFADRPEMEGENFLNVQDARGTFIIRDMLDIVKTENEGFYEYLWTRPGKEKKDYRKLSYIKAHNELEWFIGAGEYLDDMEGDVKAEVLEHINQIRFGKDGYIFVFNRIDGLVHSHPNQELVGTYMKDWSDRTLFTKIQDVVNQLGYGSVRYLWPKEKGDRLTEKYTFVQRLPEWDWVLAAGFHLDDFEKQMWGKREELQAEMEAAFTQGAVVVVIMILMMLVVGRLIALKIKKNLRLFDDFFQNSAVSSHKIAENRVVFREFDSIAKAANQMIDERQRIVKESDELHKKIEQNQKLEAIGTLAGGIAHDFNNLLTSIVGNVSLLALKLGKGDERYKHIEALDEAAQRARDLVAQILTFGRRSSTATGLMNINQIIDKSLNLLEASLPSSVSIQKNIPSLPCVIDGDETQLQQIIMNLCTNAYQALPERKGEIKVDLVSIELSALSGFVQQKMKGSSRFVAVLTVQDNGVGIPEDILAHIFEPFFSTKKVGEGTGLGLSVIHTIIERHGGVIEVESEPDKGATFTVYLPLSEENIIEKTDAELTFQKGSGRILLVDDEPLILQTNSQILEEFGYSVITMSCSNKAIDYLSSGEDVDLLITDQTMPQMSGVELVKKARQVSPHLPIILCTGYSDSIDEKSAIAVGSNAFLMKPMDIGVLTSTVARLIKGE